MDLTRLVLRAAGSRPRVLLAAMPGGVAVRLAAERELRSRGWPLAVAPAEANVLLVAGLAEEELAAAVNTVWAAMSSPRTRAQAHRADQIGGVLDGAQRDLVDPHRQRADAATEAQAAPPPADQSAKGEPGQHDSDPRSGDGAAGQHGHGSQRQQHPGHARPDTADHDAGSVRSDPTGGHHASGRHSDHDREDADQPGGPVGAGSDRRQGHGQTGPGAGHGDAGDHAGHGMHDMAGMSMPGGLTMAGRGEDRDGLCLDQLHLAIGPLLADWPAGLVLQVTIQGDVIQEAHARVLPGDHQEVDSWWLQPWQRAAAGQPVTVGQAARHRAAAHLDSLGRLLAVAGWADAAGAARRLRDDLLADAPTGQVRRAVGRFARRVARSRTLRWGTRGLGVLTADQARAAEVTGPACRAAGDVTDRYRQWLTELVTDVDRLDDPTALDPTAMDAPRGHWDADGSASAALLAVLPRMVMGADLAAARLIVASLDPDLDDLSHDRRAVGHV